MATRTIKSKTDDTMLTDWQSQPEVAPSSIRKEGTLTAQIFLFVGFFLTLVGILSLVPLPERWTFFLRPGLGYMSLTIGVMLILYHCHVDHELQFRVLYAMAALGLLIGAVFVRLIVLTRENADAYFYAIGLPMLFVSLGFIIGVVRHETDAFRHKALRFIVLFAGSAMLFYATLRGHLSVDFLTTEGIVLLLTGLAYVAAFLGLSGEREDWMPTIAWALAAAALLNIAIVVARSLLNNSFFVPSGLIFIGVSLLAILISGLLLCDWPVVVLFKRELTGTFYSPIAYLVLVGCSIVFGINLLFFVDNLAPRQAMIEPIVERYVVALFPVFAVMALVPILTMRVFAEEKRSGSLEVLLTAPVNEGSVVFGKLAAAIVFFMVAWLPFFLFAVSMRVFGGAEFDYRPLLSFFLALLFTGGALVSVGLFFSSLTSNQLIAAVFTFAVMVGELMLWFLQYTIPGNMGDFFGSVSFLELWQETSKGYLPMKLFALHAATMVFFAYLTTIVLSARKWK
jgi:ABC-2 type transport system permease protein